MPSLAKLFKGKDSSSKKQQQQQPFVHGTTPPIEKPRWTDAWVRTRVDPEEVAELLSGCTQELKSRALDIPFLLLPFRPTSDPSAARSFVRNYFSPPNGRPALRGGNLLNELRLTEPMVLSSVVKWCWSRLPGGIVTWEAYELFKIGEKDAQYARDAFTTFIPISVESEARKDIVFSFFELMAAIAAHGKTNGLGGRKLSRYAGWWAFEHYDTGKGFDVGYRGWSSAANAASHLFFAYLRSLALDAVGGTKGIIGLPLSLQQLVQATEYPPDAPSQMLNRTTKVVMIVNTVSPTPYDLLRRAKNFEYREDDHALQRFADYDDPVRALTEECRRVLRCISSTNQSNVSTAKASTSLKAASWSRFEDIGFGASAEDDDDDGEELSASMLGPIRQASGLTSQAVSSAGDRGRPTTPSWADFLSSGFVDDQRDKSPSMLLPPDKVLPPIQTASRGQSSQSIQKSNGSEPVMEPGELASIEQLLLDDSFWWVWISSLAGEEPASRKAVFGRCALIETAFTNGSWMIMEEQVKGAAPEPSPEAHVVEKKGFLGFTTKRGRLTRKRSDLRKKSSPHEDHQPPLSVESPIHRTNIAPDQHARVQAAAVQLQRRDKERRLLADQTRRGRRDDANSVKTNSVMTMQPGMLTEASQALKWAHQYDKNEIRAKYLGDALAGRGSSADLGLPAAPAAVPSNDSRVILPTETSQERELPSLPHDQKSTEAEGASQSKTPSLSKSPLPPSPKQDKDVENPLPENPLPETPSAPAATTDDQSVLPPTPPPSDRPVVAIGPPLPPSPPAPTSPSEMMPPKQSASPPDSPTTRQLRGSPTEPSVKGPESPPSIPRKALGNISDASKLIKQRNPAGRTRAVSGGKRVRDVPSQEPTSPSNGDVSPAAAAARAALAGRTSASKGDSTSQHSQPWSGSQPGPASVNNSSLRSGAAAAPPPPPIKRSNHETSSDARRQIRPSPENVPLSQGFRGHESNSASTRPSPANIPLPQSFQGRSNEPPVGLREEHQSRSRDIRTTAEARPSRPKPESIPLPPSFHGGNEAHNFTSRTNGDGESLSRINTNEKEQADRAFSTFDQGPLLDQPAFAPAQSPDGGDSGAEIGTPYFEEPASRMGSGSFNPPPSSSPPLPPSPTLPKLSAASLASSKKATATAESRPVDNISPVQDRWAQIRKNAAERATKPSNEPPRASDDNEANGGVETNGEETIESRVARIKARVAELTGNIEGKKQ